MSINNNRSKVALITGSARRIGACIAEHLHRQGLNVIIHYKDSEAEAVQLCNKLNKIKANSAISIQMDIRKTKGLDQFVTQSASQWGRLDVLVNNASSFYPTPIGSVTEEAWDDLMGSNAKAAFFLSQALAPELRRNQGSIINIADYHARYPLRAYGAYCIAKAALVMATKSLAKELSPDVRVNCIAPGLIMWPEGDNALNEKTKERLIDKTALKRAGEAQDIANAAWFLINDANYMTGQTLNVNGGR